MVGERKLVACGLGGCGGLGGLGGLGGTQLAISSNAQMPSTGKDLFFISQTVYMLKNGGTMRSHGEGQIWFQF
ncbi:hypothetical protein ACDQ55_09820 [Chitinophaga sp. 30R24]|uniref:hypothetical protein n=1 Tax=Chitinophaga sp. 30R24 TaxID=3248838 RepID=UPI003B90344C